MTEAIPEHDELPENKVELRWGIKILLTSEREGEWR